MPDSTSLDTAPLRLLTIGQLIRAAREAADRSLRDCAQFIGISPRRLAAYENGTREPSFIELEALAHYLDVPVSALLSEEGARQLPRLQVHDLKALMQLRARVVGARLRQARLEKGESLKVAAQALGLSAGRLNGYELGLRPLPITVLERAMAHYGLSVEQLLDLGIGPLGEAQLRRQHHSRFDALPDDVRNFIGRPSSLPFLRLAMHLSTMPRQELHGLTKVLRALTDDEQAPG